MRRHNYHEEIEVYGAADRVRAEAGGAKLGVIYEVSLRVKRTRTFTPWLGALWCRALTIKQPCLLLVLVSFVFQVRDSPYVI